MNDLAEDVARLYQQAVLRHAAAPLHAHMPVIVHGTGSGDNTLCGDHVDVFLRQDGAGNLAEIGFAAEGCAIARAAADMMADTLQGATPAAARDLASQFRTMIETGDSAHPDLAPLRSFAGVHDYPSRRRCALLPWEALLSAIENCERAS